MQENSAGRPARAVRLLQRVLRSVGPGEAGRELAVLRGRANVTLALAWFDAGRSEQAFALLDQTQRQADAADDGVVRALATIQRSGLYGRLGDWRSALTEMATIDLRSPDLSPRAACAVAINAGLCHQLLNELGPSEQSLSAGLALATEHGIDDLAAAATHNLGRLEFVKGNIAHSLDLMSRARELSDVVRRSQFDLDRARVLLDAGLLDAADTLLAECEVVARANGLAHDLGEITMERARLALLLGEYPTARQRAQTAARSFSRRREQAWRTQAELLAIEADLAGRTRPGRRRSVARRAVELDDGDAATSGVGTAATLLAAEALALDGDPDAAAARLARVRPRTALSFPDRLHLHLVRATVSVARADPAGATRHLRSAVTALAHEQGRYAALDTRTAVALHGRRLQTLDLALAIGAGSPRRVFAATERWRGVSNRLPRVSPTDDPALDDLVAQLRQARAELRDTGPADRAVAQTKVTRIERSVQQRDWETAADGGHRDRRVLARPVDVDWLQEDLRRRDGQGAVISFFVHDQRLRAVTIEPGQAQVHDLAPADEVAELTRRLAADLVAVGRATEPRLRVVVERSLTSAVAAVGAVLAPAVPDQSRLTVLPSRLLSSLPWGLLPQVAGRAITVAPSATFWSRETHAAPRQNSAVVCVAGPHLHRAEEEVAAIAALVPSTRVLAGEAATGVALTEALRDARVVHVAAHGSHHEQSPLFSSILLVDGPLFAHEFQRVGVGAEHVVLSACDVGRARVRPGEEGLGLTSALLACGVRTVVAAVAPVRDEVAAAVMTTYHRELLAGADAALALERAGADVPDGRFFCAYGADWALAR